MKLFVSDLDERCVMSLVLHLRRAKCPAEYAGNGKVQRRGPWDFSKTVVDEFSLPPNELYATSPEIPSGGYLRDIGTLRICELASKLGLVHVTEYNGDMVFALTELGERVQESDWKQ